MGQYLSTSQTPIRKAQSIQPRAVTYESKDIPIPDDFLRGPPEKPVTCTPVPFATSDVPEYAKCYAVTLDNVVSPEECAQLIQLAEESVLPASEDDPNQGPWRPAMIAVAPGLEGPAPGYRESDRIVWDRQELTDRIWERCCRAEGLAEQLAVVRSDDGYGPLGRPAGQWELSRINKRMRFLRYSPGQFFKPHVDGPVSYEEDGNMFQTQYTVHLYLNDSAEASPGSELVGGATGFLSRDRERRIDINPKEGSVLIFQHKRLLHEGAKVKKGQKFTVRMDVLYKWVEDTIPDAA
ncbi:unnamed protein product [Clonostachys rhizophaga]|uniref:Prolyl 4-hydroxylase alpha subunit domain-containing protein n=1 Tax=Clonostachys rhizophaga TaxID=160324 RepID=A0A9N9VEL7_9HYPO|nr:unnamed protein product [Clonostachys rhizophaga]